MYRFLLFASTMFICSSCANQDERSATHTEKKTENQQPICGASPPVLDRSKIEKMLENNGTITAEMSTEERKRIVSDFIKRKINIHKDCKKL